MSQEKGGSQDNRVNQDANQAKTPTVQSNMARNGIILGVFAIVTTGLIALTYFGTKQQIAEQQQQKLLSILNAVVNENSYDNQIHLDCAQIQDPKYLGDNKPHRIYRARLEGDAAAVAIETTAPDGYSGKIHLVVGMFSANAENALVSGVRILSHKETPGLGDKIELRISDWILDFNQQEYNQNNAHMWAVKKDGGQFDQFTGATITPRSVVKAVKKSIEFYLKNKETIFNAENACAIPTTAEMSNLDE